MALAVKRAVKQFALVGSIASLVADGIPVAGQFDVRVKDDVLSIIGCPAVHGRRERRELSRRLNHIRIPRRSGSRRERGFLRLA